MEIWLVLLGVVVICAVFCLADKWANDGRGMDRHNPNDR